MALPYLACMLAISQFHHLPPRLLPSIQAVEGGYPGAIHHNRDGSDDFGVMQINSRWVQPLAAYIVLFAAAPHDPRRGAGAPDCRSVLQYRGGRRDPAGGV